MDRLLLLVPIYLFSICIAHAVLFKRMLREPIWKPRGDWDDALPIFLAFMVLMFLIAVRNPRRYGRVVREAVIWPWAVFRAVQRRFGGVASHPATPAAPPTSAPRLAPTYLTDLLAASGFPATAHNVGAVRERVGILFALEVRGLVAEQGTTADWERFVAATGPRDEADWPQQLLDRAAVAWPHTGPRLAELPQRCRGLLLATVGRRDGSFFGGDPAIPLPAATAWNLRVLTGEVGADSTAAGTPSTPASSAPAPPAPRPRRAPSAPSLLPRDAVALLAEYGRFRFDATSFESSPDIRLGPHDWRFYQEFLTASGAEPRRFLHDLRERVGDRDDWSTLGGARLCHEELEVDQDAPDFHALMAAAIQVVRQHGSLDMDLTGFERDWLRRHPHAVEVPPPRPSPTATEWNMRIVDRAGSPLLPPPASPR